MNTVLFKKKISLAAIVVVATFSWNAGSVSAGPGQAVGGLLAPAVCTQGFKMGPKDSKGNYKCTSNKTVCGPNQLVFGPKYVAGTQKFEYSCFFPVKSTTVPKGSNNLRKK